MASTVLLRRAADAALGRAAAAAVLPAAGAAPAPVPGAPAAVDVIVLVLLLAGAAAVPALPNVPNARAEVVVAPVLGGVALPPSWSTVSAGLPGTAAPGPGPPRVKVVLEAPAAGVPNDSVGAALLLVPLPVVLGAAPDTAVVAEPPAGELLRPVPVKLNPLVLGAAAVMDVAVGGLAAVLVLPNPPKPVVLPPVEAAGVAAEPPALGAVVLLLLKLNPDVAGAAAAAVVPVLPVLTPAGVPKLKENPVDMVGRVLALWALLHRPNVAEMRRRLATCH